MTMIIQPVSHVAGFLQPLPSPYVAGVFLELACACTTSASGVALSLWLRRSALRLLLLFLPTLEDTPV